MPRIALLTCVIGVAPRVSERMKGFAQRIDAVEAEAEQYPGCVAMARVANPPETNPYEQDWGPWGTYVTPRFYTGPRERELRTDAETLSVWDDLESVFAFSYSGLHAEALRHRREWFPKGEFPIYVAWWVADDHIPTWTEACERIDYLHQNGASPHAFDFRHPFDAEGQPVKIRRKADPSSERRSSSEPLVESPTS